MILLINFADFLVERMSESQPPEGVRAVRICLEMQHGIVGRLWGEAPPRC